MSENASPVNLEIKDSIAHIAFDDGKVNAISPSVAEALDKALDDAGKDGSGCEVVVISGRPGVFSAGFDLKVIQGSPEGASALMKSGFAMFNKIFSYPKPVVAACTGHGIAAGAIMLMCADLRIGADDDSFQIGLNEVAIGLEVPYFLIDLAKTRLANERIYESLALSKLYTPKEAVNAGFLDALVSPDKVVDEAFKRAETLKEYLKTEAYQKTKHRLRKDASQKMSDAYK